MRPIKKWINHCLVIGLLLITVSAHAATYDLVKTYYGTNQSGAYGWSMASIGSNKILIGSPADRTAGLDAGAAYLMDATTGDILLTVPNPTPIQYDIFGQAVAFVGNNLLVGANWDGANGNHQGAAYLFDGTSGSLLRTFKAPVVSGFSGYSYGSALAVVGSNILIGEEDAAAGGHLTAYLYNSTNGSLLRTISNIGERSGRTSANSYLAVAGNNVLVGPPGNSSEVGGASLYDTTNGNLLRTFSNPFITAQDNFGFEVATLPGDRFAISAPWADRGETNSGAVYIFDGSTGDLLQTLLNPNSSADVNFGISIAAVGDNLLVGAPYADFGATNAGATYLFSTTTGNLLHTFLNPTPQDNDWFGRSVASFGNDFLIAAVGDNTMNVFAGAVYRYEGVMVPEPSSIVLFALASMSLMTIRRRHERNA